MSRNHKVLKRDRERAVRERRARKRAQRQEKAAQRRADQADSSLAPRNVDAL